MTASEARKKTEIALEKRAMKELPSIELEIEERANQGGEFLMLPEEISTELKALLEKNGFSVEIRAGEGRTIIEW